MNILRQSLLTTLDVWLNEFAGEEAGNLIRELVNHLTDFQLLDMMRAHCIVEQDDYSEIGE